MSAAAAKNRNQSVALRETDAREIALALTPTPRTLHERRSEIEIVRCRERDFFSLSSASVTLVGGQTYLDHHFFLDISF